MPLAFDQSAPPGEGKEVRNLMEFLYTFIKLIQDERIVQELQNLIRQYDIGRIDPLLNKAVHQLSKKRRTNKELHLNVQMGEYDIDYVVLDLGSEIIVMTKQTWCCGGQSPYGLALRFILCMQIRPKESYFLSSSQT